MVEAVSYQRPSVAKSILATSVAAGVLNAGLQAGLEAYGARRDAKFYKNLSHDCFVEAARLKKNGNLKKSGKLFAAAKQIEKQIKNCKINWKNVAKGAAAGAIATAVICTVFHAIGSCFNRK